MTTSVECTTAECSEYGVEKTLFGGGEIDETIPTYCGGCGALLLGEEPAPPAASLEVAEGDGSITWEQVPEDVTYEK